MFPEPFQIQDFDVANVVESVHGEQAIENSEVSLALGQAVFRDRQRIIEKKHLIAIVLGAVAACFLISTVTLGVLYGNLLQHRHEPLPSSTLTTTVTVHHTSYHTTTYSYPLPTTTYTAASTVTLKPPAITITASATMVLVSPSHPQPTQCWPGSIWGGAELRKVNKGYTVQMSFALSHSDLGRKGLITDYDLVGLRSIFLCGESMSPVELQILYVCKNAYVFYGENISCDENGNI
ncbi:hypothetical protein N8I77_002555 [Diaporthe amygdali]|uniref:Uncharacterized protein n=1 Tax=Phomopsis amygdali TaxID=1214568 RepID=A0AAD9WBX2_PHOAM|nr:hypothetical protein N8I77_002555 [Diaporthe amygdali]